MKRVYTLYRVSTKGQVDKDDIPMQKQTCHEFVDANPDWKITEEFYEKGVSGFKVSAKDRDVIQKIQADAVAGKFEILLVFMFDRIGRKEDETPFLVQWFSENGIEVWSVKEGEQRFDTHVDKLMNYIRYWQASGESIKTSVRTSTRMAQITQQGQYKGGTPPFGYNLVNHGRLNKRGREVKDLEINEGEAVSVRLIFDKYVNAGFGTQTIARYLTEKGIRNRRGDNFVSPSIRNILKNVAYLGILRCGDSRSDVLPHLIIIDQDIFERAQELAKQRSNDYEERRTMPKTTSGHALMSGNIFCGHCGGRLNASSAYKKYVKADGTEERKHYWTYRCYNGMRHKEKCDGQRAYKSKRIDTAVDELLTEVFDHCKGVSVSDLVDAEYGSERKACEANLNKALEIKKKATADLDSLKIEIANALAGKSSFTPDMLRESIELLEIQKSEAETEVEKLTAELDDASLTLSRLKLQKKKLLNWADLWRDCPPSEKKMIVSHMIDRVTVYRGNTIAVEFSAYVRAFLSAPEQQENAENQRFLKVVENTGIEPVAS